MDFTNRTFSSILLFTTAILCFIGFILHLICFWNPYDGMLLFHRIVLSTTCLLCALCGACIHEDYSSTGQSRFETRLMFSILLIFVIVLLLISLIMFARIWGANVFVEGLELKEIVEKYEIIVLWIIIMISIISIILLLIVVIVNLWILSQNWGDLSFDE